MRIGVGTILGQLAAGVSVEEILDSFPDLEADDVQAAQLYAYELYEAVEG